MGVGTKVYNLMLCGLEGGTMGFSKVVAMGAVGGE